MELIRGLHNLRPRHQGCVATVGAFDGVHYGHQVVLKQLTDKAQSMGLPSAVVIFEPLPREYFAPDVSPARLMSFHEKLQMFRDLKIDRLLLIRFNASLSEMTAKQFVQQVFLKGLGARHIIVGDDLHFGRKRGGDIDLLREMGEIYDFDVEAASTCSVEGERISSTRIRKTLEDNDFQLAEQLLGRPYSISGRVVIGKQLGRQIGAPTANVELKRLRAPMAGVYAVDVDIDGITHQGVANVGTRPTIDDNLKAILEVHLLDFSSDIYGKKINVIFRKKLRDEVKFESLGALKEQIQRDFEIGRQYFENISI